MACPNGYIELNGDCVYAFGNASGVGPDGTPLPASPSGGFWDWVNKNLPDILETAGSVWKNSQQNKGPAGTPAAPPSPEPAPRNPLPVWVWIGLAALVVLVVLLLFRRKN